MTFRIAHACLAAGLASIAASTAGAQTATGKRDVMSHTISGFNVVLVLGDTEKGRSSIENLSETAAEALKDMGQFLPYKSYRVLDTQWMSCCSPQPSTTVSGRLQALVDFPGTAGKTVQMLQKYLFSITASASVDSIPVRFVLGAEEGPSSAGSEGRALERERQDLQAQIATLRAQITEMQRRVEVGAAAATEVRPLRDRLQSLERRLTDVRADAEASAHGGRPIIDSSFTMNAGETVVVGTSKLGGDKALIAVVTAVKKGGNR